MTDELIQQFDDAMLNIYKRAKSECGYTASYYFRMISDDGGYLAAKKLVAGDPTTGFTRLWELKRLDLTVEALVLQPKYRPLFSQDLLDQAQARLKEYGYTVQL